MLEISPPLWHGSTASPYLNLAKATMDESAKAHVTGLLKSGKKILAIRYVKDTLKVRLKDAKKTVEELEKTIPGIAADASPWAYRPLVLVLLVFGSLGLAMLGIAGYIFYSQNTSIETSDLITGQVIRMKADRDGMTAPVIEYEWKGQKWLHASTTYSSPPAYALNEEVPIYVNRKDPTDITIDTFMDRWLVITILGSMGFVFAGIPVLITQLGRRRQQRMNR